MANCCEPDLATHLTVTTPGFPSMFNRQDVLDDPIALNTNLGRLLDPESIDHQRSKWRFFEF